MQQAAAPTHELLVLEPTTEYGLLRCCRGARTVTKRALGQAR